MLHGGAMTKQLKIVKQIEIPKQSKIVKQFEIPKQLEFTKQYVTRHSNYEIL